MNFFSSLKEARDAVSISEKEAITGKLLENFEESFNSADHEVPAGNWDKPSYAEFIEIVPGARVPRRNNLHTVEGLARFLHAIVHIEYSAIDLALDHAFRFRNLPADFYRDWLEVADEEILHFQLLLNLLTTLNHKYGDFPVHSGLHTAAQRSEESLAMRMAAVPRYMEANGLDAHAALRNKASVFPETMRPPFLEALDIIARDEIDHVRKGDKWFKYACKRENIPPEDYEALVAQAVPGAKFSRKNVNREARLKAGFSVAEVQRLENKG